MAFIRLDPATREHLERRHRESWRWQMVVHDEAPACIVTFGVSWNRATFTPQEYMAVAIRQRALIRRQRRLACQ